MKKRKFIFILFLLVSISGMSQSIVHTNLWPLDSSYSFNYIIRRYDIKFDLGKATLLPEDSVFLDSLADFLIIHKELIVAIDVHLVYSSSGDINRLSSQRAISISDFLVKKGVAREQLVTYGYGCVKPIYPPEVLNKAKTKKEKDSLNLLNRRVEFRVYGFIPANEKLFSLNDSVFTTGEVYRTNQIYFDLAKSSLRPEGKLVLDSIAEFMQQHPNLRFEVGCHLDSRTSVAYSVRLSETRAKSIGDYLISKGIPSDRFTTVGYEGNQPIYSDEVIKREMDKTKQEYLYSLNRRTEFKIIAITK
jgi:outer membrane protein OmpA-like peptidoglycan-associated protein